MLSSSGLSLESKAPEAVSGTRWLSIQYRSRRVITPDQLLWGTGDPRLELIGLNSFSLKYELSTKDDGDPQGLK